MRTQPFQDNRERDNFKILMLERVWLGSFSVPLSSIYISGGIVGSFQVRLPRMHFGYEVEAKDEVMQFSESECLLHVSLSLDPLVSTRPDTLKYKFVPGESEKLLDYASEWQKKHSNNRRKVLVRKSDDKYRQYLTNPVR